MNIKAYKRVLASLMACVSAYKEYAKKDPFMTTRIKDWEESIDIGREDLLEPDDSRIVRAPDEPNPDQLIDFATLKIHDASKRLPARNSLVLVSGGIARWNGEYWKTETGEDHGRRIEWEVKWWAPMLYDSDVIRKP